MTDTLAEPTPPPVGSIVPTLEARGISKSFGSVQALTDVDFEVRSGEVMALVGDNGAGKSTLIKCIAGIYPIDEGEIFFDGEHVSINGPKDAARLGIRDGDWATLETRRGEVTLRAQVVTTIRPDTIFIPYHWGEQLAMNQLTNPVLDPISKIPEFKACAARIEKIHSRQLPIMGERRKGVSRSEVVSRK